MPSTHSSLHYHIVFSTRDREPWFHAEMLSDLHAYLGGVVNGLDGHSHINGGVSDHVHLLVGLKPTHRLCDFMSELKSVSSSWVKEKLKASAFSWQEGYGAFTVGAPELDKVREYISHQAEHHRKRSFKEEYVTMLNRGMVESKEAYLWRSGIFCLPCFHYRGLDTGASFAWGSLQHRLPSPRASSPLCH